jgi:hypothetical protein
MAEERSNAYLVGGWNPIDPLERGPPSTCLRRNRWVVIEARMGGSVVTYVDR